MSHPVDVESESLLIANAASYGSTPQTHQHDPESDRPSIPETAVNGRNLSWTSAYILVISRVIGSGIFAMPGSILRSVGSVGISLLLWIAGALLAWCSLAVSLEYGCALPRSGNLKVYLEYTYPRPRYLASTLVAVQAVLLGFTASNCVVFSEYVFFAFGVTPSDVAQKVLAVGLLTAITIIHGCFLKTGIWIQNALGWLKVALIIFMSLTGLFVVLLRNGDEPSIELSSLNGIFEDSNWGWGVISTALFKIFYTFAGLDNVNNVLNEVKNPVGTLKSVGPLALLTACFLYMLVNVAYFLVVPVKEIKESGELIAALFTAEVFGPKVGRTFLPLAIATSAAGNVMVVTFALARLNQEVARQGFLPFSRLLSSSKPLNSPLGGLIVHFIPSALVIALPPSRDVYAFIADVEGYAGQFFVLAVSLGLIWLRSKEPYLKRPFRAWIPAVWLRVLVSVALIVAPLFPPEDGDKDVSFFYAAYVVVAISTLLFGVVYWYVWTRAIPMWRGTKLIEHSKTLSDGTTIKELVQVKIE